MGPKSPNNKPLLIKKPVKKPAGWFFLKPAVEKPIEKTKTKTKI
jgi:hypothetical protein